ncbi:MAG TPA: hypothetical protein PLR79_04600 [Acinetobacter sp.]|jgi:hypothetical protein|nr:hypothetical protein [Acinetobacter sp.]HQW54157.1 hypothetical protein [Acinetobacter sp.]HQZ59589.1 hypothetical protein [Acinetobacter sp.]HRA91445.1 hypothetical protein [Acinetobacter sp.]
MLQIFLLVLSAMTFVFMASDPRSSESVEAKSAWHELEDSTPAKLETIQKESDSKVS